jgi:hypothetical protein
MRLDNCPGDSQAQAGMTRGIGAGLVGAVKSLEHARQILRGDARAGIGDS